MANMRYDLDLLYSTIAMRNHNMDMIYSAIRREKLVESRIYLDFFHVFVDFISELLLICFTSTTLFLAIKFLKHIDKDMITPVLLTRLEKGIVFVQSTHFLSLTRGSN